MFELRTSSLDSISCSELFLLHISVMLTFDFYLMSVLLDNNYSVMQFIRLKAIDGS